MNRETLPDGSLGHISGFPPGDGQGVILQGSRFAYRKIWVAQVDETSEGINCPLDLVKDWVEVQCWRPSTGRTTTEGASGVFTLRGITCGNWRLRSGLINVPAVFGSIIHVFLVGEVQSVSKGFSLLSI